MHEVVIGVFIGLLAGGVYWLGFVMGKLDEKMAQTLREADALLHRIEQGIAAVEEK